MIAFRDDDERPNRPRLREWRQFRGLSLGELGQLVGAPEDEIASYEDDPQRQMPLKMQFRSMEALRITPEQFVDEPPAARREQH
jgi:hypothetical protein